MSLPSCQNVRNSPSGIHVCWRRDLLTPSSPPPRWPEGSHAPLLGTAHSPTGCASQCSNFIFQSSAQPGYLVAIHQTRLWKVYTKRDFFKSDWGAQRIRRMAGEQAAAATTC